jgi:hypothetical protein
MSTPNSDPALPVIPSTVNPVIVPTQESAVDLVPVKKKAATVAPKQELPVIAVKAVTPPSFSDSIQGQLQETLKKLSPGSKEMKTLSVTKQEVPGTEMVTIESKGLVYAKIKKEAGNPVVRLYAFIPADMSDAVTTLVKESGIGATFSKDSFTRPSAI